MTTPYDNAISIGHRYDLVVAKTVDFGVFLNAGDLGEVLLPRKYVPKGLAAGDSIDVFLYLDSEDRPIATTQQAKVEVGEFAYLPVVATNRIGAFLDWGLEKDLLVPFSEQHRPMDAGHSYIVHVYQDQHDGRIVASSRIERFLDDDGSHDFRPGQAVELIVANSTELGYKAIVNHTHWGVLYRNEVFQRLSFGQRISGFIKYIRPDGRLDLSLQRGEEARDKNAAMIEDYLRSRDGFAPVHDKSDPQLIADLFGISKGAFKRAIGGLYKQKVISIEKDGIRLLEP